jgi:hypothetical protein
MAAWSIFAVALPTRPLNYGLSCFPRGLSRPDQIAEHHGNRLLAMQTSMNMIEVSVF